MVIAFQFRKIKKEWGGGGWHPKCSYLSGSGKLSCLLGTSLPASAGAHCEIRANQGKAIVTLSALKFIYIVCDMISIGTGAVVLFGLIAGKLLGDYTVFFLRLALATSVAGQLFPSDNGSNQAGISYRAAPRYSAFCHAWNESNQRVRAWSVPIKPGIQKTAGVVTLW
jgi:hypothetical protein